MGARDKVILGIEPYGSEVRCEDDLVDLPVGCGSISRCAAAIDPSIGRWRRDFPESGVAIPSSGGLGEPVVGVIGASGFWHHSKPYCGAWKGHERRGDLYKLGNRSRFSCGAVPVSAANCRFLGAAFEIRWCLPGRCAPIVA